MDAAAFQRVSTVFEAARGLTPAQRADYLDRACVGDQPLRARVESLLREHERPSSPLDQAGGALPRIIAANHAGERIGRYRLVEPIGEGGMGIVFRAEQLEPVHRTVALKVIKLGMDTKQVVARFEAERQALALMDHPNIATVLDAGATDMGRPYFVMELVDGVPITEHCDRHRLTIGQRVELFRDVCAAVQHAHQKGIIHRDLKPSNILVTSDGDRAVPKVIDFGVAKATHQRLTEKTYSTQHRLIGTPQYMSPEQADLGPADVDTRSDVYSLGVVLYELLTGTPPLDRRDLESAGYSDIQRMIREVEPPRPSTRLGRRTSTVSVADAAEEDGSGPSPIEIAQRRGTEPVALRRQLRGDLDWVVMKCLEKEPDRRYETADALAQDLRRALAHEPIVAGPPGPAYRVRKFVRRNRVAVIAAALVLVTLVAGLSAALAGLAASVRSGHELEAELVASRIEQGRLMGYAGNSSDAMDALWPEFLNAPDSYHARWALWELYMRHPQLGEFYGHELSPGVTPDPRNVSTLAFTPDGRRIVTGGADHLVRSWEIGSQRCTTTLRGHESAVSALATAPGGLLSGDADGVLIVWDGESLVARVEGHRGGVRAIAVTPDGQLVASTGGDGVVRLWDAGSLELRLEIEGDGTPRTRLAITPDGRHVVTGDQAGRVRIDDVGTGRVIASIDAHEQRVYSLAVSPDGRTLATGSTDKLIRLWDLETLECIRTIAGNNGSLYALGFLDDGATLLAAGWTRFDLWDVATGQRARSIACRSRVCAIDPTGALVARGGIVSIWELSPNPGMRRLPGHDGRTAARLSGDGRMLATGDGAGVVRVWDSRDGRIVHRLDGHRGRVRSLQFSPDGARLATGGDDQTMRLWDVASGACLAIFDDHQDTSVGSICYSSDGRLLAHSVQGGGILIRDLETSEETRIAPTSAETKNLCFNPGGTMLASTAREYLVRLWTPSGEPLAVLQSGEAGSYWSIDFAADGRRLATGSWGHDVEIWDVETRSRIAALRGHAGPVWSVDWHPQDPRLLVSSSDDGVAKIWDVHEQRCLATLDAFDKASALTVEFSPDGRHVIAAGGEGNVVIWDLRHFDRHVAGSLERRLIVHGARGDPIADEDRLRAWAREVLARPWEGTHPRRQVRSGFVGPLSPN